MLIAAVLQCDKGVINRGLTRARLTLHLRRGQCHYMNQSGSPNARQKTELFYYDVSMDLPCAAFAYVV